jgi:hypothetical protein
MTTQAKWGPADDAKLSHLFRKGSTNGGTDTEDLGVVCVKSVWDKHFKNGDCKNFAPLHRKKARAWNLGKSLEGSRPADPKERSESDELPVVVHPDVTGWSDRHRNLLISL